MSHNARKHLAKDIEAYNKQFPQLRERYMGKFVVFKDGQFVSSFDDFDSAIKFAVTKFGEKAAFIRQVRDPDNDGYEGISFAGMNGLLYP